MGTDYRVFCSIHTWFNELCTPILFAQYFVVVTERVRHRLKTWSENCDGESRPSIMRQNSANTLEKGMNFKLVMIRHVQIEPGIRAVLLSNFIVMGLAVSIFWYISYPWKSVRSFLIVTSYNHRLHVYIIGLQALFIMSQTQFLALSSSQPINATIDSVPFKYTELYALTDCNTFSAQEKGHMLHSTKQPNYHTFLLHVNHFYDRSSNQDKPLCIW